MQVTEMFAYTEQKLILAQLSPGDQMILSGDETGGCHTQARQIHTLQTLCTDNWELKDEGNEIHHPA